MAELGILLTPTEERSLVEFVLSKGAFLVPDVDYPSGEYATVQSVSDFLRYRAATRLFFIVREDYMIAPLEMRQTAKGANSTSTSKAGNYAPDRELPRDKGGRPIPETNPDGSKAGPHTQLGQKESSAKGVGIPRVASLMLKAGTSKTWTSRTMGGEIIATTPASHRSQDWKARQR